MLASKINSQPPVIQSGLQKQDKIKKNFGINVALVILASLGALFASVSTCFGFFCFPVIIIPSIAGVVVSIGIVALGILRTPDLMGGLMCSAKQVKAFAPMAAALTDEIRSSFAAVHSGDLCELSENFNINNPRESFFEQNGTRNPVISREISWIPKKLHEHLLRDKRDLALGWKWLPENPEKSRPATLITNTEAIFSSLVPEITVAKMVGDYYWDNKNGFPHKCAIYPLSKNQCHQARKVIISNVPQLDFECDGEDNTGLGEVVMKIARIPEQQIAGEELSEYPASDEQLKKHLIYHLICNKRMDPIKDLHVNKFEDQLQELERLIQDKNGGYPLQNKAVEVSLNSSSKENAVIFLSLEILFNLYIKQIESEFSLLNEFLPQGYVYTIDPAAIFMKKIGGVQIGGKLLNRLQILAFKFLKENQPELFSHLKKIAFNDFADQGAISLLKAVFDNVSSKAELFDSVTHFYKPQKTEGNYALVLHNNGDAFGQNIQFEGAGGSLDGTFGFYSDASYHLHLKKGNRIILPAI